MLVVRVLGHRRTRPGHPSARKVRGAAASPRCCPPQQLKSVGHVLDVRVDLWEFDVSQDVRGTLITLVLNALQEQLTSQDADLPASRTSAAST